MSQKLDWLKIEKALGVAAKISPHFIRNCLVVGGGASLLYNYHLKRNNDSSFPFVEPFSNQTSFSHDVDFTHVYFEDYEEAFKDHIKYGKNHRPFIEVEGVRFGFLQFGCTFEPEEEMKIAKQFLIEENDVVLNVLHPASLFREKTYLIEKGRGKPNDEFHQRIAKQFCLWDLATTNDKPVLMEILKDKCPEIIKDILLK